MTSHADIPKSIETERPERRLWRIDLNEIYVLGPGGFPLTVARSMGQLDGPLTVHVGFEVTDEMRARATRAIAEVTAGGIPFGKPSKRNTTKVSASLVAEVALAAAFSTSYPTGEGS